MEAGSHLILARKPDQQQRINSMGQFITEVKIICDAFGTSEDIELVVDYDYYPFERGTREDGLQVEPDTEEEWSINSIESYSLVPEPLEIAIADYLHSCGDMDALIESIKKAAEL
jgi:hypothetical protein